MYYLILALLFVSCGRPDEGGWSINPKPVVPPAADFSVMLPKDMSVPPDLLMSTPNDATVVSHKAPDMSVRKDVCDDNEHGGCGG